MMESKLKVGDKVIFYNSSTGEVKFATILVMGVIGTRYPIKLRIDASGHNTHAMRTELVLRTPLLEALC
jgi:predicted RNA-binding protein with PUA-like domain